MDLFEKYHKNNKYIMLAYMNNKIPSNFSIYNIGGKYKLKYSEEYKPQILKQVGGDIEEFIHDDNKYIFDIYTKKDSDIRRIFIRTFDSKSDDIEEGSYAQLSYISKSNIINIESLNGLRNCIQLKSNKLKKVDKQGTMLVYAIIEWAKKKKFKKITLEDISRVYCEDSKLKLSYSLFKVHTFQYGYPWYWTLIKKQSFFIN